jgi:glycosyltransferase involved in cell wall biosynthesis
MRYTEADRNWEIDYETFQHPFHIDKGFYKMTGRFHLHFNPRLIFKIIRYNRNAELIVGASWNDLNILILVLLKRVGILKNQLHFWSEANYLTIGSSNDNFFKKFLRKFVFNSSDGMLVSPGKMTEITFKKWGIRNKKLVLLPNTIEEEKFVISDENIISRYKYEIPVFLMPVRLVEKIKGMINFFTAIGSDNIRKGLFLIAGEGPDKQIIQEFISSHQLQKNIEILGHCDIEKMVSLYKRANIFILPSFSDPSPLTLVEALSMKLPVLISERCGNHFEAVRAGENGYIFNPLDAVGIKLSFEILLAQESEWRAMGEVSGNLYNEKFNSDTVIENFVQSLTQFEDYTN